MTIMGSSSESANKLKVSLLYDPAIPVLGIWYLQSWFWKYIDRITNKENVIHRYTHKLLFSSRRIKFWYLQQALC